MFPFNANATVINAFFWMVEISVCNFLPNSCPLSENASEASIIFCTSPYLLNAAIGLSVMVLFPWGIFPGFYFNYEKKIVIVNHSTNINNMLIEIRAVVCAQKCCSLDFLMNRKFKGPELGQAHKCGWVKPVNVITTLPYDNWLSSDNTDIYKQ